MLGYWFRTGTAISIPPWYLDAPLAGAVLYPNFDVIVLYPGTGQIKLKSLLKDDGEGEFDILKNLNSNWTSSLDCFE